MKHVAIAEANINQNKKKDKIGDFTHLFFSYIRYVCLTNGFPMANKNVYSGCFMFIFLQAFHELILFTFSNQMLRPKLWRSKIVRCFKNQKKNAVFMFI